MNDKIYENMQKHDELLGQNACFDNEAIYLQNTYNDLRTPFFHDTDKILYSLAYARYMDKTQVFATRDNDHIQSRMLHVQYVSKIARTIGRALNLNEDLIEAAALGHDIGHTPFGHEGEKILDEISKSLNEGAFRHNINSVRMLVFVENYGKGHNLSLQVLDGIMCHNGELVSNEYYPKKKTIEDFWNEYYNSYTSDDIARYLRPMTLEGCVVRISDIIAYLGRDIEDAARKGIVTFEDIPDSISKVLGTTNSEIVNTIVCDIIQNSFNKPYIAMSDDVFKAIKDLKSFNNKNIYQKSLTDSQREKLKNMFLTLTNKYLDDLKTNNKESIIYKSYLNKMDKSYLENTNERIVIDYISGMTDDFFLEQYHNLNIKSEN